VTLLEPGQATRAACASRPGQSRGRRFEEPESATRSPFQRDRDRILHSTAFRRLTHKTQVFVSEEGDHFRTRLTHTLEVAQIARTIARILGLDEDLTEAIALAHDLGHTPFGHEGEDVLNACLAGHGGFDHNAQSFRIVTRLERRYAGFDGLNLSWETLEGIVKHNGPLLDADGRPTGRYLNRGLPHALLAHANAAGADLRLDTHASAEAQVAAIADDIAYDAHDIDDGVRAGLFEVAALEPVPVVGEALARVRSAHPGLETSRLVHEITRHTVGALVEDVVAETRRRLAALRPADADAVRMAGAPVVGFSPAMAEAERAIKRFLFAAVYRHPQVQGVRRLAGGVVRDLYTALAADPSILPERWRRGLAGASAAAGARRVADYIAGMTDRFALEEHRRLFDDTPELR
jgi:dGTPase